jgi:hypothetical protein
MPKVNCRPIMKSPIPFSYNNDSDDEEEDNRLEI